MYYREFREFNAFDIVRKLYPKFLILSKLSLIIGAVIVFTDIKKVIGGSLTTAAYTPETNSVKTIPIS